MKQLLDFECASSFLDLLIASIEDKLDINIDDFPIDDNGKPIIDFIMVDYLEWTVKAALKVTGTPDLETFIANTQADLREKDYEFDIELLRKFANDMIDKCKDEIQAWVSVVVSFKKHQTINDKMITTIAEHYNLY